METQPDHLKSSHEGLRAILRRAAREPGNTGETARRVAALAEGHFLREEKFLVPLLALLPALASGAGAGRDAQAPFLAQTLRQELGSMLEEHRQMGAALREFARAAQAQGKIEYHGFVEDMLRHMHAEERVLYPAAIVAGEYVGLLGR